MRIKKFFESYNFNIDGFVKTNNANINKLTYGDFLALLEMGYINIDHEDVYEYLYDIINDYKLFNVVIIFDEFSEDKVLYQLFSESIIYEYQIDSSEYDLGFNCIVYNNCVISLIGEDVLYNSTPQIIVLDSVISIAYKSIDNSFYLICVDINNKKIIKK